MYVRMTDYNENVDLQNSWIIHKNAGWMKKLHHFWKTEKNKNNTAKNWYNNVL